MISDRGASECEMGRGGLSLIGSSLPLPRSSSILPCPCPADAQRLEVDHVLDLFGELLPWDLQLLPEEPRKDIELLEVCVGEGDYLREERI